MNSLSQASTKRRSVVLSRPFFTALAVLVMVCGIVITYLLASAEDARMRANLLIQAKMVATLISAENVKGLKGTPEDAGFPVYREIKDHIIRLRAANPLCRFIYLTGMRADGVVFFFMDSEPPDSNEYSPPGQKYVEVSEEFRQVFQSGKELVEGPVADRWGNWVSALFPIRDPGTAKPLAVLGMDIDARDWNRKIVIRCAPALTLTLLLAACLTFFYILFHRAEKARRQIALSEARLAESERAYRSVVTNMLDIFFRVNDQGVIVMASPSAAKLLGYADLDELVGNKAEVLWVNPQHQAMLYMELKKRGEVRDWELAVKRKGGAQLEMSVSMHAILDESGQLRGYEGIARDISERKQAEKQQQEMEAQIQRAQKMEALGTLAGGVAHDLNNILSGIVSYPDLILAQTPESSPLRRPLTTIRQSGIKAAAIVQDLLTLARRGVSVSEVVNLNELTAAYLQSPEHQKLLSFHPRIRVQTALDDSLLNVLGSPVHLSKTLMNLVSNAAEAIADSGSICIATRNRYVDYPIKGYDRVQEGDYVLLLVTDTGVGIPQEDQARIFEPFFTKKKLGRSGTGLGMAVVWGTVKDHKGYIDIHSTIGNGTTFTLYFPATRIAPSKQENGIDLDRLKGNGEKILVIDDVSEQREVASDILSQLGYTVTTLASGEQAVRYLETGKADLLLLDMIMEPGMDGLQTYRQIRASTPGQRAIICSGFSENDRVKEAQQLGAGRYLKKPYTLEELGRAVQEALCPKT